MIKDQIHAILKKAIEDAGYSSERFTLSPPANPDFGDYTSTIAMQLAKDLKKDPFEVAADIAQNIPISYPIGSAKIIRPGFINISIAAYTLLSEIENILDKGPEYGTSDRYKGQKVIVEYSSPNIAKPFTIGHLRSTIIGDAVANLLEATGYTVYRDNHVGDWGTQFGKQIYAIQKWGNIDVIEKSEHPVKDLVALYVKFHEEVENHPEIEEEARAIFKKLEDGDQDIRALWVKCVEWSWKEFEQIYKKLGVSFTENNGRGYGESFFENKMKPVIEELQEKQLIKESEGAKLVFFPDEKLPPFMIMKQDGATLYSTRDLATDKYRLTNDRYGSDVKIINEVGAEQSLYFKQLYETEQMLGWTKPDQRMHIKHGLYRFKDMKMSTRKGNTIWLEDVLVEVEKRALDLGKTSDESSEASQKHDLSDEEKHQTARIVGIGAIKWNDLKRSSHLDIVFDWDEILNMQGNSGPYIQYSYVRCQSILSHDSTVNEIGDIHFEKEELNLLRILHKYPEVVLNASEAFAPHYIASYLFDLAQLYNLFYQKHPILKSEDPQKSLRILLTKATSHVLHNGLKLLGIDTVEKM